MWICSMHDLCLSGRSDGVASCSDWPAILVRSVDISTRFVFLAAPVLVSPHPCGTRCDVFEHELDRDPRWQIWQSSRSSRLCVRSTMAFLRSSAASQTFWGSFWIVQRMHGGPYFGRKVIPCPKGLRHELDRVE